MAPVIVSPIPKPFFGWAGDLASQAGPLALILKRARIPETAANAEFYASLVGRAGLIDMNTDIDAENIAQDIFSWNKTISEMLDEYYPADNSKRCKMFINGLYNGSEQLLSNSVESELTGHVSVIENQLHGLADVWETVMEINSR